MSIHSALCKPNTYSDTGIEPCTQCPPNHYQTEHGSSECSLCTNETTFLDECTTSKASITSTSKSIYVISCVDVGAYFLLGGTCRGITALSHFY